MRYLRTILKRLAVLVVLICCAGCSYDADKPQNKIRPINEEDYGNYALELSSSFAVSSGVYSLSSTRNSKDNAVMIGSASDNVYSLISFLDTSSWKSVTLCNKPNCSHSDDTCNAYIPSFMSVKEEGGQVRFPTMKGSGYIFGQDGKMYLIDPYGDITAMNEDGTEHQKLLSIDSKYEIVSGFLYNSKVYLNVNFLPSYDKNIEQEFSDEDNYIGLLEIDLQNKSCKELFSFKTELNTTLLGLYENKAYYFYRSPNKLPDGNTQKAVDEVENSHDVRLYTYDLTSGKKEILKDTVKSYEMDDVILAQDSIYYHNRKTQTMERLYLDSGETQTVISELGGYINFFTYNAFDDNKLFFIKDNYLADAYTSLNPKNETFYVDLENGEVKRVDYVCNKNNRTQQNLIGFYAVTDDYFVFDKDNNRNLAAVSKNDFYKGADNFIPIEQR